MIKAQQSWVKHCDIPKHKEGDLVWLEGKNLRINQPTTKLVSQTYTSVSDNAQNLGNPPDTFPTSLGKRRERPVRIGPPRTMRMKGLNNHLPIQEVWP
jgi:hypothetical protein